MGAYGPAIAAIIGSSAAQYGASLSSQDRQSFADGDPSTDPRNLLNDVVQRNRDLYSSIQNQPFYTSHIGVQGAPTFDGGGLAMPVGLLGSWGGQGGDTSLPTGGTGGGSPTSYPTTRFPNLPVPGPFNGDGPPANPPVNSGGPGRGPGGTDPPGRYAGPGVGDPTNGGGGGSGRFPGRPGPDQPGSGTTNPPAPPGIANPGFSLPPGIIPGVGRRSIGTASVSPQPEDPANDHQRLITALRALGAQF